MASWLEIHHINVVGGDATLVLVLDQVGTGAVTTKFRALIDSGAESNGPAYLKSYLESIGQATKDRPSYNGTANQCHFDLIIATHLHTDHIRGFYSINMVPARFIDTAPRNQDPASDPTYPDIGMRKNNARESAAYTSFITKAIANGTTARIPLPFTNLDNANDGFVEIQGLFPGLAGTPLKIRIVYANGILAKLGNGTERTDLFRKYNDRTRLLKANTPLARTRYLDNSSPNDFSIASVWEWSSFSYYTAGDLSGDTKDSGVPQTYMDLEQFVIGGLKTAGWLNGGSRTGYDAVKISHHGSSHSTFVTNTTSFLKEVQPKLMVVPTNQKKQVPGDKYLERAKTYLVDAQGVVGNQTDMPGLLMANSTSFRVGASDYNQLKPVYDISTQSTSPLPASGTVKVPFNLADTTVAFASGTTQTQLNNLPNGAIILVKADDVTPFLAQPFRNLGNVAHNLGNFVAISRSYGPDPNAVQATGTSVNFKAPRLSVLAFSMRGRVDEDYMKGVAGHAFDEATDRIRKNGQGSGTNYVNVNLPELFNIYNEVINRNTFIANSYQILYSILKECYSSDYLTTKDETIFDLKSTYLDNDIPIIETCKTIVNQYFLYSRELGYLGYSRNHVRDLVNSSTRTRRRSHSVSSGASIKKKKTSNKKADSGATTLVDA